MNYLNRSIKNPFLAGSIIMIVGSNGINVFNYIYHFLMGKLLQPESYGELVALFSFIGILSILPGALGLVIIKFISGSPESRVAHLIAWFFKKTLLLSSLAFLILLLSTPFISKFLNITSILSVGFIAVAFFFALPNILLRSSLQGLLKFKELMITNFVEIPVKLGLAIASGFFVSKYYLKKYLNNSPQSPPEARQIGIFTVPVLFQSLALTSLYTIDLILVKHFFSGTEAGIYSAASTLSKIILFGTAPIVGVMFPLISKRFANREPVAKIFLSSLGLTILMCSVAIGMFTARPLLFTNLLYGSSFAGASLLLTKFSLTIGIYTISALLLNFYLAIHRLKIITLPLIASLMQIIGIWVFHSSLDMVLNINLSINALLLVCLLGPVTLTFKDLFKIKPVVP